MSYQILPYTYQQAQKLGVKVKPSTVKGKKVDVYKKGEKVASIGDKSYSDYPHYKQKDPKLAEERRKAYKARHRHTMDKVGTPSYYVSRLLW